MPFFSPFIIQHSSRSLVASALFLVLICVDVANAQQPIPELGGWPPGSFTLLAGLWLAVDSLSHSRFDVLPPVLFARFLHYSPRLRKFFTMKEPSGHMVKQIVLAIDDPWDGRCIAPEWDTLILRRRRRGISSSSPPETPKELEWIDDPDDPKVFTIKLCDGEREVELEVNAGVDVRRFREAAPTLTALLGAEGVITLSPSDWYPLQAVLANPRLSLWSKRWGSDQGKLRAAIDYYKVMMGPTSPTLSGDMRDILDNLSQKEIPMHLPDSKCGPNEWPIAAVTRSIMRAKHIAIMLAFVEYVCRDQSMMPHPLILCIYSWAWEYPAHNILIEVPSTPLSHSRRVTEARISLDLSSDKWHLDGGSGVLKGRQNLNSVFCFVAWLFSLTSASVVTFFSVVAGSTPTLAATLGLLFCRPHTAGPFPPSWNGHIRIRWGVDYAASFSSSDFHRRLGPGGHGPFRASLVYIASWITWHFRQPLRSSLQFAERPPPSQWVFRVAEVIGDITFSNWVTACIFTGLLRERKFVAILAISACYFVSSRVVTTTPFSPSGVEWFPWVFWFAEFGIFLVVPTVAIIPWGVTPSHSAFFMLNTLIWATIITSAVYAPA